MRPCEDAVVQGLVVARGRFLWVSRGGESSSVEIFSLTTFLFCSRCAAVPVHEGRILEASECGAGTGACGSGLRGLEAREVGPAQTRAARIFARGREARVPEARPLCTTAELWQDQRKAEVRSRDGESPVGDAPRQECGAGANRNRRTCQVSKPERGFRARALSCGGAERLSLKP